MTAPRRLPVRTRGTPGSGWVSVPALCVVLDPDCCRQAGVVTELAAPCRGVVSRALWVRRAAMSC